MGVSDLFKKVLIKDDQHVLYSNSSETVIYQEYLQNKSLNEQQVKQIHNLFAVSHYAAYMIKVNGGSLIPYEDETWVEQLNLPVLFHAGVLFVAYVSPNNIFSGLEIEKIILPDSCKRIKIRIFKDSEEAFTWFKSNNIF